MDLNGFNRFDFAKEGTTKPVYRRGQGPGVILMHELPGMVPACVELARSIAAADYTVYMPLFFGQPDETRSLLALVPEVIGAWCIRREFTLLRRGLTSPITTWLRWLAQEVREQTGHVKVGAIGMCLTGNFALAMLLEDCVVAPVVCQPSLPLFGGSAGRRDIGLDAAHLVCIKDRVRRDDITILGFRFLGDRIAPAARFAQMEQEFQPHFLANNLLGDDHSVLTIHFHRLSEGDQDAVWTTLITFLNDRLKGGVGTIPPKPGRPRAQRTP